MKLELEQVVIRDAELVVFFPTQAIIEGELIVAPIHTFKNIEDLPEALIEKMFHVANKMNSSMFDLLGCHGTNILIQNGEIAGQNAETLFIRLIPRYENDNIELKWEPKQAKPEDLDSVMNSLKDYDDLIKEKKFLEEQKKVANEKKEPEKIKKDEENYLLKSLRRNP